MTESSRQLKVGDRVTTDYDKKHSGITEHVIIGRRDNYGSQSRVGFQVDPPLRPLLAKSWIDADWFKPIDEERRAV